MREAGFPVPVLGYYRDGDPSVSDWHIKWAVEHGIDFFAFDYYHHYENGPNLDHNLALNEGFLKARYRGLMDFCLMWCNETANERYTEGHLLELARILTERYFSQPNHLRIDGDNVLIFSRPDHLLKSFGEEGTAKILARMGEISRAAGHGGLYPISKGHSDQEMLKRAGFRAITAYNYPTAGMTAEEKKANRAPYATMFTGMEAIWKEVTSVGVLPYIVPVSPGWDSRPWYGDRALVRTNPSPWIYREMCLAARRYVDPKLRMVIAECWNEFGEGSYVEPTLRYGFGSLDAMRDAFCPDNPLHEDATPQSVGLPLPAFSEVPRPPETLLAEGGDLMYNGGMEGDWGWGLYEGGSAPKAQPGHEGAWCLRVPAGKGVKTHCQMPVPASRRVRVTLYSTVPADGVLEVKAALFQATRWLGRYAPIATLKDSGGDWQQLDTVLHLTDPETDRFDIEFTATGGDCLVDDVVITPAPE